MLKEVITFVEKIDKEKNVKQQLVKDWKGKKIVIIKTKEKNEKITYDGFKVLDNENKIADWLNKNKYYKKIIENLDRYILPTAINKAIGSTSGLATFSFFVFKLSDKNLNNFEKKINKTKFSDENDDKIQIENIHKILKDSAYNLKEKTDGTFKYLDYYALIHTVENRFKEWEKVTDDFINDKKSYGKATQRSQGECFVCKTSGSVATPLFLTNYDQAKTFLKHVTRNSTDSKGTSLLACTKCIQKSDDFKNILNDYDIKIFPLFVKPDEIREEIKLLDHNLQESKNKFAFIFDQLKTRQNKNIFDFYLCVMSGDYFFFDYVTGYKWEIGTYTNFFEDNQRWPITRQNLEKEIVKALSGNEGIDYFGKIKGNDNQQTTLIYSFRQKLFDFVYRNQSTITDSDLRNIVLFRIEKWIRNNSVDSKSCKETLNLFFNKELLLQTYMNKNDTILDKVKQTKHSLSSDNFEKFEIRDDGEWAYFAGQLAYYLISISKSKNKNYGLLEPFTNKSTTNLVKITIEQMIERYKHEINLNNHRFRSIATKVLSYPIDRSFIELKLSFYVGTFDDNVIYSKIDEKEKHK